MKHNWAPALDGYAGIEASPDSIRARNLRARNSRAARPCSSLWSTSNIHSHIIGHRTLDDIEACQQSGAAMLLIDHRSARSLGRIRFNCDELGNITASAVSY